MFSSLLLGLQFALEYALAVGALICIFFLTGMVFIIFPRHLPLLVERPRHESYPFVFCICFLAVGYYLAFPTACLPLPYIPHCVALPRPFLYLHRDNRYEEENIMDININSSNVVPIRIYKANSFASLQSCKFDAPALAASTSSLLTTYNTTTLSSSMDLLDSDLAPESSQSQHLNLWTSFPFMRHLDFTSALPGPESSYAKSEKLQNEMRLKSGRTHAQNSDSTLEKDGKPKDARLLFLSSRTPVEEQHLAAFRAINNATFDLGCKIHYFETWLRGSNTKIQEAIASVDLEGLTTIGQDTKKTWIWQTAVQDSKKKVNLYAKLLRVLHTEFLGSKAYTDSLYLLISNLRRDIANEEKALETLYWATTIPSGHTTTASIIEDWTLLTHAARKKVYLFQDYPSTSPVSSPSTLEQHDSYLHTATSYFFSFISASQDLEDPQPPQPPQQDQDAEKEAEKSVWDERIIARFEALHELESRVHSLQGQWRDLTDQVAHLRSEVVALDRWACSGTKF